MISAWDISSDFSQITDFARHLEYIDLNGNATTLNGALLQHSKEYLLSNDGLTHWEVRWVVNKRELPTRPQLGATLRSTNYEWKIESVEDLDSRGAWRIGASTDYQVFYSTSLTLQRPQWIKDAFGAPQESWQTVASGVSASARLNRYIRRTSFPFAELLYEFRIPSDYSVSPYWKIIDEIGRPFRVREVRPLEHGNNAFRVMACFSL